MNGPDELFLALILLFVGFLSIIGLLTIVLLGFFFIFRSLHRRKSEDSNKNTERDLHQMHQLAQRLEERIASLETILMASVKKDTKKD